MMTLKSVLRQIEIKNDVSEDHLDLELDGLASIEEASQRQISFVASAKFRRQLQSTQAAVVLLSEKELGNCPATSIAIVVEDPYLAYAKISHLFDSKPGKSPGIHASAVIAESVQLGANVSVGANAVILSNVVIDNGVVIGAGCVVEAEAVIGSNSELQPRVTIAHHCVVGNHCLIQSGSVIGSSGFGYAPKPDGWQSIAQIGRVVIEDRVEIGANCTIDRGAINDTVIRSDAIIDNMVHIAHNVEIGQRTALAAQVGIAGSTTIGAGCTFGGQCGITGHITIADNSHFTGQAMVTKGTTEGGLYSSGMPAQNAKDWRKMIARLRQLESIIERLNSLEKNQREPE